MFAIPHAEKIKDSGRPGRSVGNSVSSVQEKSVAYPGPVDKITAFSSQRSQSGDTAKFRTGKGDTGANFRSYMASKHQSQVAMKGKQVK